MGDDRYLEINESEEHCDYCGGPLGGGNCEHCQDDSGIIEILDKEKQSKTGKESEKTAREFEQKVFKELTTNGFYLIRVFNRVNYQWQIEHEKIKEQLEESEQEKIYEIINELKQITGTEGKGLPDFLVVKEKKIVGFLECKSLERKLLPEQEQSFEIIKAKKIYCEKITPDNFDEKIKEVNKL